MTDFSAVQAHDVSRPLPEIDTVWFDVSTVLVMPPGFVSGITRTIYKIVEAWAANPWTKIKFCAFVPDQGLAEVCPAFLHRHMYQYDNNAPPRVQSQTVAPAAPRLNSRYWYIPWAVRHQYRSVERAVKGGVTKFCIDPNPPQPRSATRPHLPPYAPNSLIGLIEPGPRDLVFSLGGLWVFTNFATTIAQIRQRCRFHFVSLIYDLIPIITPQYVPDHFWVHSFGPSTDAQLRESALTLTISKHTKRDLLNYAHERFIPIGPIEIFTLGSDITPPDGSALAKPHLQHSRPFVLSVGTIECRKNHYGMYQAWRKLIKTLGPERTPDLVFAGKPGWHSDNLLYLIKHDPLVKDKIIVKSGLDERKSGVDDRELDWLYKNCLFTLYPSLYEGWGLPVEESFIYGKMCITTNVSSLPEVGGEFADYVEPEDVDGIVQAVIKGLDPAYRRGREDLIREKFRPNTWKQSGEQLQEILKSYYSFPADRAQLKKPLARPKSKLARAMSFFW